MVHTGVLLLPARGGQVVPSYLLLICTILNHFACRFVDLVRNASKGENAKRHAFPHRTCVSCGKGFCMFKLSNFQVEKHASSSKTL